MPNDTLTEVIASLNAHKEMLELGYYEEASHHSVTIGEIVESLQKMQQEDAEIEEAIDTLEKHIRSLGVE